MTYQNRMPTEFKPLHIPFGHGLLSLSYANSKEGKGVALCIGLLDPPIEGEEIPEDHPDSIIHFIISFRDKKSLDRLQKIHDDLLELFETGKISDAIEVTILKDSSNNNE